MSVAEIVSRFRACRGSVVLFASEGKAAEELLQSNPLAGFCLAVNDQFRPPPPVCPLANAVHMMWRPQREILGWLGFPGTEASAKLGRKCVPESLTIERCLRLRRALRQEAVRALLAHLPRINAGVMDLVAIPGAPRGLTPQLLAEVAQCREEDEAGTMAPLLEDARRMAGLLQRRRELERVRTRQRLRQLHDELTEEYNRRQQIRRSGRGFPPPPIPGMTSPAIRIVPITTPEALRALGREQHNCVASYAAQVFRGQTYIYRVQCGTEVCTLALERTRDGGWRFQDLKGVCNRPPSSNASRWVRLWLSGEHLHPPPTEPAAAPLFAGQLQR